MKEKLFKNLGLKVLAIFFACLLWLVVMNISDYQTTKKITGIPVTQLNGDVLEEHDQIYEVSKGSTVDITVKGRRSVVGSLSAADFNATADLSEMSITNTVQIKVEPTRKSIENDITITIADNVMTLNLEDKASMQFPIKVKTTGSPGEGFAVGDTTTNPGIVTIEGPKSTVEKITEVSVSVPVNGATKDLTETSEIDVLDAYGDPITSEKLTLSETKATASIKILHVKEIPVVVEFVGSPADGYAVEDTAYQPEKIHVAAEENVLASLSKLSIGDISVEGLSEDLQQSVDYTKYLPEGVFAVESDRNLVVTAKISRYVTRSYTPTAATVSIKGRQQGYTYTINLSNVKINAYGFESTLEELSLQDLALYVDCSGLAIGDDQSVELKSAEIDGVTLEILGDVTMTVTGK